MPCLSGRLERIRRGVVCWDELDPPIRVILEPMPSSGSTVKRRDFESMSSQRVLTKANFLFSARVPLACNCLTATIVPFFKLQNDRPVSPSMTTPNAPRPKIFLVRVTFFSFMRYGASECSMWSYLGAPSRRKFI